MDEHGHKHIMSRMLCSDSLQQALLPHTTQPHHASDDTKVATVASTFEFNHTAAQTMPVMMETCSCCSPVDQCSNHACHTTDNHSLPVMIKTSVPRWLCFLTCSTLVQWCLVGLSTLGPVLGVGLELMVWHGWLLVAMKGVGLCARPWCVWWGGGLQ